MSKKKTLKKKKAQNRRMRRTVMGTLSIVCMLSAIIVALIPTPKSEAASDPELEEGRDLINFGVMDSQYIPNYDSSSPVYYTGDGVLMVAYVDRPDSNFDKAGVIVHSTAPQGSSLSIKIKDKTPAYLPYANGKRDYVAVNENDEPLYFISAGMDHVHQDANGILSNVSNDVEFSLCTASNEKQWLDKEGVCLYTCDLDTKPQFDGHKVLSANSVIDISRFHRSEQLMIPICYIGSKSIEIDNNAIDMSWKRANAYNYIYVDKGVFEENKSITSVTLPDNFVAIGDNAFASSGLQSINIGSHMVYIGDHAFHKSFLSSVKFEMTDDGNGLSSSLTYIGDYAFAKTNLSEGLTLPNSLTYIGNYCFEECALKTVNLGQGGAPMRIGNGLFCKCPLLYTVHLPDKITNIDEVENLFYKCTSLKELGLPSYAGNTRDKHVFDASNVKGCYQLETVEIPATKLFMDCDCTVNEITKRYSAAEIDAKYSMSPGDFNTGASVDIFSRENLGFDVPRYDQYEVSEAFCIKASQTSYAYGYAMIHDGVSFEYTDIGYEDNYEKNVEGYAFGINGEGKLEYCHKIGPVGENVVIPSKVKGIPVNTIQTKVFSGVGSQNPQPNTEMKYVYIPEEVSTIEENAFNGCTGLRTVQFENDMTLWEVGKGAFNTRSTTAGYTEDQAFTPVDDCLRMIGNISADSEAYQYAMDPENSYNDSSVSRQYITYCGQFPENIEVRLQKIDDERGLVPMLVNLPTEDHIADYSLTAYTGDSLPESYRSDIQNGIAIGAIAHKNGGASEEEQAVLDAIYRPVIPSGVEYMSDTVLQDKPIESVTFRNLKEIPDYGFKDCKDLVEVNINPSLEEIGEIPFNGCDKLLYVNFGGSDKFTCETAIIYENDEDGKTIVECLETRGKVDGIGSSVVGKSEFKDVTEIKPRAFKDCDGITIASLSESQIKRVPDQCFMNDTSLFMCTLPTSLEEIGDEAFENTRLSSLDIPVDVATFGRDAFDNIETLSVDCPEGPTAQVYNYFHDRGAKVDPMEPDAFNVVFVYGTNEHYQTTVKKGEAAIAPTIDDPDFIGWDVDFSKVTSNLIVTAQYNRENNVMDGYCDVEFMDDDGNWYGSQQVLPGECVKEVADPVRKGYIFMAWKPSNYAELPVTRNPWIVTAKFIRDPDLVDNDDPTQTFTVTFVDVDGKTVLDSQTVLYGELAVPTTVVPKRDGYEFSTWSPSNYAEIPVKEDITVTALYQKSATDSSDNITGNAGSDIAGGSSGSSGGSGNGNNAGSGGSSGTTGKPSGSGSAGATTNSSPGSSASKPTGSSGSVSSNSSSGNKKPSSGKDTKVDITKSGISNKNLGSASVSGSNDNFIVKITDSEEAKNAVEQALLAEYGSLDNIKFFAMDISLYDSTGVSKIIDTSGLKVTVTIPLPDVMAGYAGNNKAMSVKNGKMEKLNSRLITIDNVPCISFEATHFSPYAIYVETNNLTATGVSDATPKTGDPIHPKWFLALGLALMSVILFLGKGSKNKIVKVMK